MGELTGEDWFVSHWGRQADATRRDLPLDPSAGDRTGTVSWAQHEAEQVWYFARCDFDTIELTSLENRLYYGPVGSVEGFSQPSPGAPVQFNMELYGQHHSALFSLHDGRLNVLNQLPEHEPLDLFVRQLNESLERSSRRLVEVSEWAGTMRLAKSPRPVPSSARRKGRTSVLLVALVGLVAAAGGILILLARSGSDGEVTSTTVLPWGERASVTTHPSVDCRLGVERRDPSIEVFEVDVTGHDGSGVVSVTLGGTPFDRFSTTVEVVVPDEPLAAVDSYAALSYLFLPGRRWRYELHAGVATVAGMSTGADGSLGAGEPPGVVVETSPAGSHIVRFTIPDFPAADAAFDGSVIVATFGTPERTGGSEPAACTANLVTTVSA